VQQNNVYQRILDYVVILVLSDIEIREIHKYTFVKIPNYIRDSDF